MEILIHAITLKYIYIYIFGYPCHIPLQFSDSGAEQSLFFVSTHSLGHKHKISQGAKRGT